MADPATLLAVIWFPVQSCIQSTGEESMLFTADAVSAGQPTTSDRLILRQAYRLQCVPELARQAG